MVSTVQLATLLVVPLIVLACEGECIIGITNEYLNLYNPIILNTFQNMARTLARTPHVDVHNTPSRFIGRPDRRSNRSARQPPPRRNQLLHPHTQRVQQRLLQRPRTRDISLVLSRQMSLPKRHGAQRLPEPRLSGRVWHARIHGPFLPKADPNRVRSNLGPVDQHHLSQEQGVPTSQEDGVGRRPKNATESVIPGTPIRKISSTENDRGRKAIPGHHEGLSDDDAGGVWGLESWTVSLGDIHEEVHLAVPLTM